MGYLSSAQAYTDLKKYLKSLKLIREDILANGPSKYQKLFASKGSQAGANRPNPDSVEDLNICLANGKVKFVEDLKAKLVLAKAVCETDDLATFEKLPTLRNVDQSFYDYSKSFDKASGVDNVFRTYNGSFSKLDIKRFEKTHSMPSSEAVAEAKKAAEAARAKYNSAVENKKKAHANLWKRRFLFLLPVAALILSVGAVGALGYLGFSALATGALSLTWAGLATAIIPATAMAVFARKVIFKKWLESAAEKLGLARGGYKNAKKLILDRDADKNYIGASVELTRAEVEYQNLLAYLAAINAGYQYENGFVPNDAKTEPKVEATNTHSNLENENEKLQEGALVNPDEALKRQAEEENLNSTRQQKEAELEHVLEKNVDENKPVEDREEKQEEPLKVQPIVINNPTIEEDDEKDKQVEMKEEPKIIETEIDDDEPVKNNEKNAVEQESGNRLDEDNDSQKEATDTSSQTVSGVENNYVEENKITENQNGGDDKKTQQNQTGVIAGFFEQQEISHESKGTEKPVAVEGVNSEEEQTEKPKLVNIPLDFFVDKSSATKKEEDDKSNSADLDDEYDYDIDDVEDQRSLKERIIDGGKSILGKIADGFKKTYKNIRDYIVAEDEDEIDDSTIIEEKDNGDLEVIDVADNKITDAQDKNEIALDNNETKLESNNEEPNIENQPPKVSEEYAREGAGTINAVNEGSAVYRENGPKLKIMPGAVKIDETSVEENKEESEVEETFVGQQESAEAGEVAKDGGVEKSHVRAGKLTDFVGAEETTSLENAQDNSITEDNAVETGNNAQDSPVENNAVGTDDVSGEIVEAIEETDNNVDNSEEVVDNSPETHEEYPKVQRTVETAGARGLVREGKAKFVSSYFEEARANEDSVEETNESNNEENNHEKSHVRAGKLTNFVVAENVNQDVDTHNDAVESDVVESNDYPVTRGRIVETAGVAGMIRDGKAVNPEDVAGKSVTQINKERRVNARNEGMNDLSKSKTGLSVDEMYRIITEALEDSYTGNFDEISPADFAVLQEETNRLYRDALVKKWRSTTPEELMSVAYAEYIKSACDHYGKFVTRTYNEDVTDEQLRIIKKINPAILREANSELSYEELKDKKSVLTARATAYSKLVKFKESEMTVRENAGEFAGVNNEEQRNLAVADNVLIKEKEQLAKVRLKQINAELEVRNQAIYESVSGELRESLKTGVKKFEFTKADLAIAEKRCEKLYEEASSEMSKTFNKPSKKQQYAIASERVEALKEDSALLRAYGLYKAVNNANVADMEFPLVMSGADSLTLRYLEKLLRGVNGRATKKSEVVAIEAGREEHLEQYSSLKVQEEIAKEAGRTLSEEDSKLLEELQPIVEQEMQARLSVMAEEIRQRIDTKVDNMQQSGKEFNSSQQQEIKEIVRIAREMNNRSKWNEEQVEGAGLTCYSLTMQVREAGKTVIKELKTLTNPVPESTTQKLKHLELDEIKHEIGANIGSASSNKAKIGPLSLKNDDNEAMGR